MENYSDRHLNVFEAFSQSGILPTENNISRGLAIVLQEEPVILMMLINLIKSKISEQGNSQQEKVDNLDGEYNVFFQYDTRNFEYCSKVIGVSLTEGVQDLKYTAGSTPENKRYITDISIVYGEMLIVIEVKRTAENPESQLSDQVNSILNNINNKDRDSVVCLGLVSLKWSDIVGVLRDYEAIKDGHVGRLLRDYRYFLLSHYPSWDIVEELNKLGAEDTERIRRRLENIKQDYACKKNLVLNNRGNVLIDGCEYVNEFSLYQQANGDIRFSVWIADTVGQGRGLYYKSTFNNAKISEVRQKNEVLGLNTEFAPYVKFSHIMGKGITSIDMKGDLFEKNLCAWKNLAVERIGKIKKETDGWKEMLNCLEERIDWWKDNGIRTRVEEAFQKKNFAFVSFGIAIHISMKFEQAQNIEKDNKWEETLSSLVGIVKSF